MMKLLVERTGLEYRKAGTLDIACTRPPVVFGDGRDRGAVLWAGRFASYPAVGKKAELPFSAGSKESWIYVDDCAEQFIRLALKAEPLSHFAYNTGGFSHSAREMMEMVREIVPDTRVEYDESVPRSLLVDDTDGTRIQGEIGFTLRPMREALRLHIEEARFRAGLEI
jgi:nucleoside-diphosphate-sugar epimerase